MRRKSTYACLIMLVGSLCACATQQTVQSTAPVSQAAECEKWVQAARKGDAVSQLNAGVCYQYGQLGEPDYLNAADWYRRAALQGNMRAETNLGWLYDNGMGVKQDFSQARYWYEKAAAQGESNAEDDLGLFYEYGKSVPKITPPLLPTFRRPLIREILMPRIISHTCMNMVRASPGIIPLQSCGCAWRHSMVISGRNNNFQAFTAPLEPPLWNKTKPFWIGHGPAHSRVHQTWKISR